MFGRRVFIFAGNTLIDVYAMSHSREFAHLTAEEFIAGSTSTTARRPHSSRV